MKLELDDPLEKSLDIFMVKFYTNVVRFTVVNLEDAKMSKI